MPHLRHVGLVLALAIAAIAGPAAAEPAERATAALRLSGSIGVLEELTWAAPGVDLVGRYRLGRALAGLQLGYAPIDNHTYLSDARVIRLGASGGIRLDNARVAAVVALEHMAFHADPDILAELPATDLLRRRTELVGTAGLEVAIDLAPHAAAGLFTRASLGDLELVRAADGQQRRARLLVAGAFVEVRFPPAR